MTHSTFFRIGWITLQNWGSCNISSGKHTKTGGLQCRQNFRFFGYFVKYFVGYYRYSIASKSVEVGERFHNKIKNEDVVEAFDSE